MFVSATFATMSYFALSYHPLSQNNGRCCFRQNSGTLVLLSQGWGRSTGIRLLCRSAVLVMEGLNPPAPPPLCFNVLILSHYCPTRDGGGGRRGSGYLSPSDIWRVTGGHRGLQPSVT